MPKQRTIPLLTLTLSVACTLALPFAAPELQERQKKDDQIRDEEREDYYKKWLDEDAVYIIQPQEREVFHRLTTDEEREQFIEQFWFRRDPDIRTAVNEFKEEHYRRVAYANERFASGVRGWKTDRGRIYIIHGDPAEIEKHYSGESYQRPEHEGGGFTSVVPFEIWRYRYIEGIGPDVELEFVDPTRTREFRLARNPWEKDEMLFVPGAALTTAESLGLMERGDHPYFTPTNRDRYPGMRYRAKDNPFTRYETLITVGTAKDITYKDLKEIVDVNVSYADLPFRTRNDYFRLNESRTLAAVSIEVENKDLTFRNENGVAIARVALYALVTSMTNRVITEFEHDLMVSFRPEDLEIGRQGRSIYQKLVPVDRKMRYKIDLVLKDLHSEQIGIKRQAILPPKNAPEKLGASSLILSDYLVDLGDVPQKEEMFVIGDVKVRPNLRKIFTKDRPLALYLHLYNTVLDQTTLEPALRVEYQLLRGEEIVLNEIDESGESIQYFTGDRVVLIKGFPIIRLEPGRYRLKVDVVDRLSEQSLSLSERFEIVLPHEATR